MQIKEGVSLAGLNFNMRYALIQAEKVWRKHGKELVVTSGLDGSHSAGSLHYYGLALDFRTRYFSEQEVSLVFRDLHNALYKFGFTVLLEKTHIHVHLTPEDNL